MKRTPAVENQNQGADTLESVDRFSEELVDLRDNYKAHWERIQQELRRLLETNPERLRFGPRYHIMTNRGEQIKISTLFYDTPCNDNDDGDERRDYMLIAQDESGGILGDDYRKLRFNKRLNFIDAKGIISVGEKSRGIGTPLHLVLRDLFQREANRRQSEVQWKIHDANLETLKVLEKQNKKKIDPMLAEKVEAMRKEHLRWIALYGGEGKLGFNSSGRKNFQPDGPSEDLESVSDITLERGDGTSGKVYGKEVSKLITENKSKLREEHLQELRDLLQK